MTVTVLMCVECGRNERWSRGLCSGCYSTAHRGGFLEDYPTKAFLENPEPFIRWAMGYEMGLVEEIAVEYGVRVVKNVP